MRFSAYLVFMILFCIFIYCPLAHWTWHPNGFLHNLMGVGIHDFAGGIVATVFTGIFAQTGLIAWTHAGFMEFAASVVGVAIVIAYTFVVSMALYWIVNRMIPMRVSAESEKLGLDASQHDEVYNPAA